MLDSQQFAELSVASLAGQPALGFSRLILSVAFRLEPTPQQRSGVTIVEVGGELWAIGAARTTQYVGRLQPMNPPIRIDQRDYGQTQQEQLEIELNPQRLSAIEALRLGKNLDFDARLRMRVLAPSEQVPGRELTLTERVEYHVPQSAWLEILEQVGYRRTLLIEVPLPDAQVNPQLAAAVANLAKAQQALLRGEYREAVGCSRDVLESLSAALGDRDDQDTEVQQLFANSRQMDKAARLRVLRRALKLITHPARHADQGAASIDWTRDDAIAMVTMLAALLQRMVEAP
jgi:hypothetical protein